MKDRIEIYVQPGEFGLHAGGRRPCTAWGAHKDDPTTAAWRCALRWWFPRRPNGVLLYQEATSITVNALGNNVYEAILELPDDAARKMQFRRNFTPTIPALAHTDRAAESHTLSCDKCGRKNFTPAGIARHKCKPSTKTPQRKARKK